MSASKLKPLNEFNVEDSPYKVFEKLVNADFYAPPSNALIQPNKKFHLAENYDCPNPDLKNFAYPTVKIGDLALALLVPDRLLPKSSDILHARFRYRTVNKKVVHLPDIEVNTKKLTIQCAIHDLGFEGCGCLQFLPPFAFLIERPTFPRILVYSKTLNPDFSVNTDTESPKYAYWCIDHFQWLVFKRPRLHSDPTVLNRIDSHLPIFETEIRDGLLASVTDEEEEPPAKRVCNTPATPTFPSGTFPLSGQSHAPAPANAWYQSSQMGSYASHYDMGYRSANPNPGTSQQRSENDLYYSYAPMYGYYQPTMSNQALNPAIQAPMPQMQQE